MGLCQSSYRVDCFALLQIDDADAVVTQFGNEQALPFDVNRHVIDAAAHPAKGNLGLELQKSPAFCRLRQQRV